MNCQQEDNEVPSCSNIQDTVTNWNETAIDSDNDRNPTNNQVAPNDIADIEITSDNKYIGGESISEPRTFVNQSNPMVMQLSPNSEPIHMTLEEVRNSLSTHAKNRLSSSDEALFPATTSYNCMATTTQKITNGCDENFDEAALQKKCHRKSFPASFKHHFKNIFSMKKSQSADSSLSKQTPIKLEDVPDWVLCGPSHSLSNPVISPFNQRTLPPVPSAYYDEEDINSDCKCDTFDDREFSFNNSDSRNSMKPGDFASSLEKVKDYGWYWGPVNGQIAEKLLSTEPDGSFIVRDSSDEHYIFSLTFKFNSLVRHVRIEHDQGNFSFGGLQKFKSTTIVEFIENAVEHSRSGRYLFFLNRRPILGPIRVQLLHPISRFKHVQSLQHQCRFIILKQVRKDLISNLPLPERLKEYLSSPHYYSEMVELLWEKENLVIDNMKSDANIAQSDIESQSGDEADVISNDLSADESLEINHQQGSSCSSTPEIMEENEFNSLTLPSESNCDDKFIGDSPTESSQLKTQPVSSNICDISSVVSPEMSLNISLNIEEAHIHPDIPNTIDNDHYEQLKDNTIKSSLFDEEEDLEISPNPQPEYLDPHNLGVR